MSQQSCPFGHGDIAIVEEIRADTLKRAYWNRAKVAIDDDLKGISAIGFYRCRSCELGFFTPATPASAAVYEQLGRVPGYYQETKDEYALAQRRIGPNARVLEIGCGRGAFASYIPERDYIGLEINQDAVEAGRAKGLDVRTDDLPAFSQAHPASFDVVCAFQVLEHVSDPASFIAASVACLRPGGLLLYGVPNADAFLGIQPDEIFNLPPHHLTWWCAETFWRISERFGVEVEAVEGMPLRYEHRSQYQRGVVIRALQRRFGTASLFFFEGWRYDLCNYIAGMLAPLVLRGIYDQHLMPQGHSMLAVLRKK